MASAKARGFPRIAGDKSGADLSSWFGPAGCPMGGGPLERATADRRQLAWDKLAGNAAWDNFSDVEFAWHSRKGKGAFVEG